MPLASKALSLALLTAALPLGPLLGAATAETYAYRTARGLYDDCAAPAKLGNGAPSAQRARCTEYLEQVLNAWNLNQDNRVCSRSAGAALPDAYLRYWQARGLGLLTGELKSAEASVNEFLDSQRQACQSAGRDSER